MLGAPRKRWNWDGYYDPKPKLLLSTIEDARPGAAFQEIESARFGSFEAAWRGFSLYWTLGPLQVRSGNGRTFRTVDQRPRFSLPGDSDHGEWEGVERTLLLYVSDDLFEESIHRSLTGVARPRLVDEQCNKLHSTTCN